MKDLQSNSSASLPVYETFYAFQGEGTHIGRAAFFIRTIGCPVQCSWCDSIGTWHKDHLPSKIEKIPVVELAQMARMSGASFAVITGGEPAIYDLTALTTALHDQGLQTHIETSGAYSIRGDFDWITVSPKWNMLPLAENVQKASEIKIIMENADSAEEWWNEIGEYCLPNEVRLSAPDIWLQPEANSLSVELLDGITRAVKSHPRRYRAGVQLHKVYNCDMLDPNSKAPISLK
ncbi:7-carboxy-7-deazaguanine synthase QueE [Parabacteroides sp. FAFU027]|uniref:7-carboxy-7-deazaguanine synthase QueE n=1 Tax=Parabacteroides sp. FAFU027 TaxID=2922715 RepID=UPI001FAF806C|nr:7-carboxy-7-deazaguanine synthase QueE [Parabacteroides sp. FAFU027]